LDIRRSLFEFVSPDQLLKVQTRGTVESPATLTAILNVQDVHILVAAQQKMH
jgi:hypothetical protein